MFDFKNTNRRTRANMDTTCLLVGYIGTIIILLDIIGLITILYYVGCGIYNTYIMYKKPQNSSVKTDSEPPKYNVIEMSSVLAKSETEADT